MVPHQGQKQPSFSPPPPPPPSSPPPSAGAQRQTQTVRRELAAPAARRRGLGQAGPDCPAALLRATMSQVLFGQLVPLLVKCKDCEERRVNVRVSIELQAVSNPVHRKDLVIQLTDDADPFFLYNLVISEEDFQSLKLQQGLLVDFSAFPQKFIDLLQQCTQEQGKEIPRFLLQLVSTAAILDHSPVFLNVVETNPFKHLTHLSLKLLPGNDMEIKKFLAGCLKCSKEEKLSLEQTLEDVTRQLHFTQQTLSEKIQELDKLRNEWTSHTASLTNKHSQELTNEKEKALQAQVQFQQQHEQQKKDLESIHQRNVVQLQNRLSELEAANKDLTERKYKGDSTIRELKAKLSGVEDVWNTLFL